MSNSTQRIKWPALQMWLRDRTRAESYLPHSWPPFSCNRNERLDPLWSKKKIVCHCRRQGKHKSQPRYSFGAFNRTKRQLLTIWMKSFSLTINWVLPSQVENVTVTVDWISWQIDFGWKETAREWAQLSLIEYARVNMSQIISTKVGLFNRKIL